MHKTTIAKFFLSNVTEPVEPGFDNLDCPEDEAKKKFKWKLITSCAADGCIFHTWELIRKEF